VGQRDDQITSLSQAVGQRDDQITSLSRHLQTILNSKSWRLTKPLRYFRRVLTGQNTATWRPQVSRIAHSAWRVLPISIQGKQSLKNTLFTAAPFLFRHTGVYNNWLTFQHPVAYDTHDRLGMAGNQCAEQYVPLLQAPLLKEKSAKLICFYLPQFHPIPENDAWWGKGFTEWTNVQPAQPQFVGHYQPHEPGELGWYNLLDPAVQRRQVDLAKLYGIGGFCFYFYWFGGKRLLEKPIENFLNDKNLDLPFCLCWANENWSRRWDGLDSEILIAQEHSPEDDISFISHVARYMRDARYIRIGEKPLLLVYRPSLLPSVKETAKRWRDWCKANGIGDIYLAYTQSFETIDPSNYGFDAAIEFPPNNSAPPNITDCVTAINDGVRCTIYDWRVFVERSKCYTRSTYRLFRSVCPSWDNTARRKNRSTVFANSTPALYQQWLENAIADTLEHQQNPDERLIFVNAWNEWAEGAHLEPDARYGYAWLQATRNALVAQPPPKQRQILVVTHDCHPHGAQFLTLEITRQLVDLGYKPTILALDAGRLQAKFVLLGPMLISSAMGEAAVDAFLADLRKSGCEEAITSTVVSGSILPSLKEHGYRVISLIHELPGVIHSMNQEANAQRIADHADKIVFPANLVGEKFETIVHVPSEKVVIRPQGLLRKNPYHNNKMAAREEVLRRHGLRVDARIVLNVGYLDHRKGADIFVEIAGLVCKHREDAVFIWVGHADQEFERRVKARIEELGLQERVLLIGFDPDPLVYYAAASAYALTSREDPFPNVVLESVAVGVPVVAFEATTGATELIIRQGGKLARPFDVNNFAIRLEALLDETPGQRVEAPPNLSLQRYVLDLLHHLNGQPRVSVVVPNYNYASLIVGRLDSILAQTFPVYELIILDDASTDGSVDRIRNYFRDRDCEAKIFVNEQNSGSVFKQWVKGVQAVTGDLVWIAEADDLADPDFLSALVPAFTETGAVLAFCQSWQIDEKGNVLAHDYLAYTEDISNRWREDYSNDGMNEVRMSMAIKNVIPNVSAVLFNRKALLNAFETIGEDLFDYRVAGDWLVYLHVLAQGRVFYRAKSLNGHRRHRRSVTRSTALQSHLDEIAKVQSVAREIAPPDEDILAKASLYLTHLREQFGLDNRGVGGNSNA